MSSAGALLRVGKKKITGVGEPEPEVPAALLRPAPLRTCLKPRTSRWATRQLLPGGHTRRRRRADPAVLPPGATGCRIRGTSTRT